MVRYQLNLATKSKMIHKCKGSALLICNLLNFDGEAHIFLKSIWVPYSCYLLLGVPCPLNAQ